MELLNLSWSLLIRELTFFSPFHGGRVRMSSLIIANTDFNTVVEYSLACYSLIE